MIKVSLKHILITIVILLAIVVYSQQETFGQKVDSESETVTRCASLNKTVTDLETKSEKLCQTSHNEKGFTNNLINKRAYCRLVDEKIIAARLTKC